MAQFNIANFLTNISSKVTSWIASSQKTLLAMTYAVLITFIRFYRYAFSLLLGHRCRFEPTCSAYAIDAINIHGCGKGCYYALRRLLRCHPWHAGGMDPVPPIINQTKRC